MMSFTKFLQFHHNLKYELNFFEAGEGKNDMDRHFGIQNGFEKRYLLQCSLIQGKLMLTIGTAWNSVCLFSELELTDRLVSIQAKKVI